MLRCNIIKRLECLWGPCDGHNTHAAKGVKMTTKVYVKIKYAWGVVLGVVQGHLGLYVQYETTKIIMVIF
jgi:hypothetical protein